MRIVDVRTACAAPSCRTFVAAVRVASAMWLACLPLAHSAVAGELWRSGDAYFEWGGSLREVVVLTRGTSLTDFEQALLSSPKCGEFVSPPAADFPDCPAFAEVGETRVATSQTRLRLRFEARANSHWSAVATVDNELLAGTLDTFEASLGDSLATNTLVDASGEIGGDRVRWLYSLYRGYVFFESEHFEAVVGRQRIPWGVGRLWNPIDRFNAIAPLNIQGDQSPGVDAINARLILDGFTQIEAIFAPGGSRDDHDYAIRLQGMLVDTDYSLMVGAFDEAPTVGFDLAKNLGDAAGRAEVVYTHPMRDVWPFGDPAPQRLDDYWQLVLGVDYSFSLGSGLYALLEYLYNGNALGFGEGLAGPTLVFFEQSTSSPGWKPASSDRFGGSRVITRSHHLTGLQLGYDLTPELRLDFLTLADWDGLSAAFFPSLSYSALSWLDVTLGVQASAGPRLSEFGSNPTTGYLLADVFF